MKFAPLRGARRALETAEVGEEGEKVYGDIIKCTNVKWVVYIYVYVCFMPLRFINFFPSV